jgi:hypothetical protein
MNGHLLEGQEGGGGEEVGQHLKQGTAFAEVAMVIDSMLEKDHLPPPSLLHLHLHHLQWLCLVVPL